ncbi:MAG: hypothetical protein J6B77_01630 [Clostridia bacterium]|nr:hypothetical protein [Clostridia bacterium]
MNRFLKKMKMSQVGRIRRRLLILPTIPVIVAAVLLFAGLPLFGEDVYLVALPFVVLYFVLQIGTRNAPKLELSILEEELRSLEYDRAYFVPEQEVRVRRAWEEEVLGRCRALGLDGKELAASDGTVPLWFGCAAEEKEFVFLYSVATLDEAVYAALVEDVKARAAEVCPTLRDSDEEFASVSVLVLADTVTEDAASKAKLFPDCLDGTMAFSFVDCGRNRVYTDGTKHDSMIDKEGIRRQKLMASLVFDMKGQLPRKTEAPSEEYTALYAKLDAQTYGEFLAELKAKKDAENALRARLSDELPDGAFHLEDGVLYHKADGRLMHLEFEAVDEDASPVGDVPSVPGRELICFDFFLSWTEGSTAMSRRDKERFYPEMKAYMESLGYRVNPEDSDGEA